MNQYADYQLYIDGEPTSTIAEMSRRDVELINELYIDDREWCSGLREWKPVSSIN